MPFTFKLSQRLARMRRAAVILASATALTACEKPIPSAPTQVRPQVATIDVSPVAATLFPSQSLRRKALVSSLATFRFGLANDSTLASRMTGAPRNVPGGERRQMSTALELYGLLILTVLGFTLPILTVLLSLFPEGVRALSAKSEHERAQSEENIRSETDKQKTEKGLDYAALEATLRSLKE